MREQRAVRLTVMVVTSVALLGVLPAGSQAKAKHAAKPARLAAMYGVSGKRVLEVSGFARTARRGDRVTLETRRGRTVRRRRSARVGAGGRFRIRWRYGRSARKLEVRVRVRRRGKGRKVVAAGSWRVIRVSGLKARAKRAPLRASQIVSLPPGDTGGTLVVKGRPRVRKGQVVALGATKATPEGVLQRITDVTPAGARTALTTEPASIPDLIPAGSMDVQLPSASAPRTASVSSQRKNSQVSCSGGQSMSATADVDLSSSTRLEASWGLRSGLKAKFTGTATASAGLDAQISGAASCALARTGLFPGGIDLGTYRFTISGVPIVLQPNGQVYLSGRAEVNGKVATNASASLTGTAGVAFEDDKFTPFGEIRPQTSFSPPSLSAAGFVGLYAAPAVFVKINGIGGPEIDLQSGVELAADINKTPWWTLSSPLSAGVKFKVDVWRIKKESQRFSRLVTTRQLASAQGPFIAPPAPPQPQGPQTRAQLSWDTPTDVDLHVWDDQGREVYYRDKTAIPDARLVEDIIPGYGPEYFEETASFGRRYTYGVCQFSGDGANVSLVITDPNGQQRTATGTLDYEEDSEILDAGPDGGGYRPDYEWCDR